MGVVVLNTDEFLQTVVNEPAGKTLVKFGASWCAPCRKMEPVMRELAHTVTDVAIAEVDVEASPELATKFGIRSIPVVALFDEGELVKSKPGYQTELQLLEFLK